MARVVVIGGHGKVALELARILTERGDEVDSVFRNPDHSNDVAATGARPVVADIERLDTDALADLVAGHDAVVFSAGAGGGNPERTYAVDRDAAIRVIDAAGQAGVPRFVMVSYFGAGPDHGVPPDDPFFAYAEAKAAADAYLRPARLCWRRATVRSRAPMSRSWSRRRWPTTRPSGEPSNSTMATSPSRKRWRAD
jgi:nucleoside-diphosphate-sugar epimerase